MSVSHDTQDTHQAHQKASAQDTGASRESAAASTPLTEPLTPLESHRANAEAIERAPQTSEAVSEARRRGRIEAETHRISEEMTRLAQERRRVEEARAQVTDHSKAAGATFDTETAIPSDASYPHVTVAPLRPIPTLCQFHRMLAPLDGSFYAARALP
jgi:hypothetical protein